MSTSASACLSACVRSSSARDGSATPDGWLCAKMTAAALRASAALTISRVDAGLGKRAAKKLVGRQQSMLAVEEQHDERLVWQRCEREPQVITHGLRRRQCAAVGHLLAQQSARQLDAGLELRRLGGSYALRARELRQRFAEQAHKSSMSAQQSPRDVERGFRGRARPEHDREQLGVSERVRAVGEHSFARTLAGGPVGDARHLSSLTRHRASRDKNRIAARACAFRTSQSMQCRLARNCKHIG
jgi:hypothetical protein